MSNGLIKGRTNIVGVTGGVGAGKSAILQYLQDNYKCIVIYSDDVANLIKKKGYPAYEPLVELLGRDVLAENGEIDKKKMAEAIFNNEKLLKNVNNILHPAVNEYIINIIDNEKKKGTLDFVFVEAALLIENGYRDIVDEMWYVYADEAVRRERLKNRRGYSDEKVSAIFKSQLDDASYRKYADFIIDNNGSEGDFARQIDNKITEWRE